MNRFYTIVQVRDKDNQPKDIIKFIANILGIIPEELLNDMGYDNWFEFVMSSPSDIVVARKLNDILKEEDLSLRVGGSSSGIRFQRSIF